MSQQSIIYLLKYYTQNHKITSWWHQRKSKGIFKDGRIHLLGIMNACIIFNGNTSNNYPDISIWTKVIDRPTASHCHIQNYTASMFKKDQKKGQRAGIYYSHSQMQGRLEKKMENTGDRKRFSRKIDAISETKTIRLPQGNCENEQGYEERGYEERN